jgi:hypothetical protein
VFSIEAQNPRVCTMYLQWPGQLTAQSRGSPQHARHGAGAFGWCLLVVVFTCCGVYFLHQVAAGHRRASQVETVTHVS